MLHRKLPTSQPCQDSYKHPHMEQQMQQQKHGSSMEAAATDAAFTDAVVAPSNTLACSNLKQNTSCQGTNTVVTFAES